MDTDSNFLIGQRWADSAQTQKSQPKSTSIDRHDCVPYITVVWGSLELHHWLAWGESQGSETTLSISVWNKTTLGHDRVYCLELCYIVLSVINWNVSPSKDRNSFSSFNQPLVLIKVDFIKNIWNVSWIHPHIATWSPNTVLKHRQTHCN